MRGPCYIAIDFLTLFGKKLLPMQHISKIDPRHAHSKTTKFQMKYFGEKARCISFGRIWQKNVGSCSRTKKFQNWTQSQKQFIFGGIGDGTMGYQYYNPKTTKS